MVIGAIFSAALSFLVSSPAALELSGKLMGAMLSGDKKKAFAAHQVRTYQGIAKELGRAVAIFDQVQTKLDPAQQIALAIMYDSVLERIDEGLAACKQFEGLQIEPDLIDQAISDARTRISAYAASRRPTGPGEPESPAEPATLAPGP